MIRKKMSKYLFKRSLLVVGIALLLIGGGVWLVKAHQSSSTEPISDTPPRSANTVDYSPSNPSDNVANEQRKSNADNASQTLDNGPTKSNTSQKPAVTVTRAAVVGSNLEVGTLISGSSSGSCTLKVSQQGQDTITKIEAVQQQNNVFVCPVFKIPLSQFPNQGNWDVSVTLTTGNASTTGEWQANPVNL